MKQLIFLLFVCMVATNCLAQGAEKEKLVKAFYAGFENHDWNAVASQLADGFTFTSPNNDDHIPLEKFKERCWPTNEFFKSVTEIKMAESGNSLFLLVEIITTDGKIVRNVDLYSFEGGKIKTFECFFGPGVSFPGNKK